MPEPTQQRTPYWTVLDELRRHYYDINDRGSKPTDPGWHRCNPCGWEGYWCDWQPHVAERVTAALLPDHKIHTWEAFRFVPDAWRCLVCGQTTSVEPSVWVKPLVSQNDHSSSAGGS